MNNTNEMELGRLSSKIDGLAAFLEENLKDLLAKANTPPCDVLTKEDVLKRYRISERQLYSLMENGRFPKPFHISKREVRWSLQFLRDWEKRVSIPLEDSLLMRKAMDIAGLTEHEFYVQAIAAYTDMVISGKAKKGMSAGQ